MDDGDTLTSMTPLSPVDEVTVTSQRPLDAALTLSPHQRGPGDPAHRRSADGAIWRVSRQLSGPVTYRITQSDRHTVRVQAWGPGATEFLTGAEALLGLDDEAEDFAPEHPKLAEAHRRFPHLRIGRTGRVMEALVPAILEQRVHGIDAFAAWRRLLTKFGERPPGPAPDGMRVPLTADQWRRMPSWEFHRANVDPARSKTIVQCARVADRLEQASSFPRAEATKRLRAVPGVGIWTAAEVAQRAFGDSDALSVGDYHLAAVVGWSLLGEPIDDAQMVQYLAPLQPHRYRAVRLLQVSGQAVKPKFGPRTAVADHRWH
ncbi:DNA-3-methyladenine glycosylase family protein [Rhodococcus erythropolis]|uniref:DNA-3-methyladenine glycosylase family protein n=1 Tax=Rhodococcus erythropolis TaxID=1833 RepID=UPI0018A28273|nr:DNA-3-methyladenine glycosylase 2 family protein [Rhodococcus erythropolis]MBF7732825.1 DNA-3-methyladenine glycosylase 2 family protein [Rhodococcus erythropolis]MCZ4641484.1 DNA-3-methyladenine glycosylase 2 family protein [Rhodococcus erythropolis]